MQERFKVTGSDGGMFSCFTEVNSLEAALQLAKEWFGQWSTVTIEKL